MPRIFPRDGLAFAGGFRHATGLLSGTPLAQRIAMSTSTSALTVRLIAAMAVCLTAAVHASPARAQASNQPAGWDASLRLREAADLNPAPDVVEINLEAVVAKVDLGNGQSVEAWTYNGGLPGPLIRTKVGDRLIVHFTNRLPAPTTVHWHGLRVPIEMDGVPGISQPPVLKGESFTYSFIVPDAGLFWYHPHVASNEQVGFGLYGPLLVEDPQEKSRLGFSDELIIVLSDIGVDEQGKLDDPNSGGTTGMAFGREGNVVLINGKVGTLGKLTVRSGAPQRWRIVNTAKSRYFAIDLDGQTFTKIGSDGGLTDAPATDTNIVIGCGERADLIVSPQGKPGTEMPFRSYVFNRGYGSVEFRPAEEILFTVAFADVPAYAGPAPTPISRPIVPLSAEGATKTTMNFTITQLPNGTFEYGINNKPHWATKPFTAKIGETQMWTLVNKTPWSHPFHLHGYFFQVVDEQGVPIRPIGWKDTVNVQFEQTVRVLVRFDDRPGEWMIHCHILDHAEGGLMSTVRVGLPDGPSAPSHQHPPAK